MSTSFTAVDVQKAKLEKLMQNIDKPIEIPQRPKDSKFAEPPDFIRNIMGSSAGAGSGEFHVYRHLRRKEYARQRFIEEQAKQEELDKKFKEAVEEKKRKVEEKTAKKRAKRLRKKEKIKQARKAKRPNRGQAKETTEEDTDDDDDESDDEEDSKSDKKSTFKSENEIKNKEKIELGDESGSKPISCEIEVTRSRAEASESSDEEIIGPMPPVDKNSEDSTVEKHDEKLHIIDKETKPESKPIADKSTNSSKEFYDEAICQKSSSNQNQDQREDEESSDDEIIGPMPI